MPRSVFQFFIFIVILAVFMPLDWTWIPWLLLWLYILWPYFKGLYICWRDDPNPGPRRIYGLWMRYWRSEKYCLHLFTDYYYKCKTCGHQGGPGFPGDC